MKSYEKTLERAVAALETIRRTSPSDVYAQDRVRFAEEALGLTLDPWQAQVVGSDSRRDLLNCSRQAGKSTTAAVLALHEAIYRPGSLSLLVSRAQRQSGELFRKVADLRDALPWTLDLSEDNRLSMHVRGGGRVVSLPGSESTIRGFSGVTLLIEDEAAQVDDELYFAVRPMLSVTNGRFLLMSTPFGKRGHFWNVWDEAEGWNKVRVPATEVPRISEGYLEVERRSLPEWWFLQEYMCEFMEATDQVFNYDLVTRSLTDDFEPFFAEARS